VTLTLTGGSSVGRAAEKDDQQPQPPPFLRSFQFVFIIVFVLSSLSGGEHVQDLLKDVDGAGVERSLSKQDHFMRN
jgi:hypothetical protein